MPSLPNNWNTTLAMYGSTGKVLVDTLNVGDSEGVGICWRLVLSSSPGSFGLSSWAVEFLIRSATGAL